MYIVVFNGIRFVVCYYIEIDVGRSKLGIFIILKMLGLGYILLCVNRSINIFGVGKFY